MDGDMWESVGAVAVRTDTKRAVIKQKLEQPEETGNAMD